MVKMGLNILSRTAPVASVLPCLNQQRRCITHLHTRSMDVVKISNFKSRSIEVHAAAASFSSGEGNFPEVPVADTRSDSCTCQVE